jgi:hypothetical protein
MIPLLAPLLGSLAGSLLPATLGTGIAGALGLSGAAGLSRGRSPQGHRRRHWHFAGRRRPWGRALNAVGFGAGGALLSGAGAGRRWRHRRTGDVGPPLHAPAPELYWSSSEAATSALPNLARSASQIAQALGGGQQTQPTMSTAPISRPPQNSALDNPLERRKNPLTPGALCLPARPSHQRSLLAAALR